MATLSPPSDMSYDQNCGKVLQADNHLALWKVSEIGKCSVYMRSYYIQGMTLHNPLKALFSSTVYTFIYVV